MFKIKNIFKKEKKGEEYISKTKSGLCKNEGCNNKRDGGSSRCKKCSIKKLTKNHESK
jgi:hypothetical protein